MDEPIDLFTERYKLKDIVIEMEKTEQKGIKKDLKNLKELTKGIAKEYDIKEDDIEFIRKKNPLKSDDIKIEDGERAAIRYVNTADVDRDNEIVMPDGGIVKDFQKSMTVLYAHDYWDLPIGRDLWIKLIEGKGWLAKTVYAEHQKAVDVYNLVKDHFLNTSSIGFIPLESITPDSKGWDKVKAKLISVYGIKEKLIDGCRRIFTKWILLEHSDVPVPSNINALNIAVGKGFIKDIELIKDIKAEIEIIESKEVKEEEVIIEGTDEKNEEIKEIIKVGLKGITPEKIDEKKVEESMEKDDKEIKSELSETIELKERDISVTVNIAGLKEMVTMVEENLKLKEKVENLESVLEVELEEPIPKEKETEEDNGIEFEEKKEKDEKIELNSDAIKDIITDVVKGQVKEVTKELSKEISDTFKRATGKIL